MRPFKYTVPCSRPATESTVNDFGNTVGEDRAVVNFDAVYVAPTTSGGSQIIDGVLRETTITKPTLYVEGRYDLRSGDYIVVNGDTGWQIDGDPAIFDHPWTGWEPPMVIELRRRSA